MGPSILGKEGRGKRGQVGPHLAGVPTLHPSTKHVIFDDPGIAVQGRIGLVLLVTVIVFHNGDCYFPQVVGWRQWHCGEKSLRTKAGGCCLFPPVLTMDVRSPQYPLLFSMTPQPATQQVFFGETFWEAAGRETGWTCSDNTTGVSSFSRAMSAPPAADNFALNLGWRMILATFLSWSFS